jgi:hypothetical protein
MAETPKSPKSSLLSERRVSLCPFCETVRGIAQRVVMGKGKRTIVYACPDCEFHWERTADDQFRSLARFLGLVPFFIPLPTDVSEICVVPFHLADSARTKPEGMR